MRPDQKEAGFTLTEVLAGLLVVSMVLVGIADISRRFVSFSTETRTISQDIVEARRIEMLLQDFGRSNVDSLVVAPSRVEAVIGSKSIVATLIPAPDGLQRLRLTTPTDAREVRAPRNARFVAVGDRAFQLQGDADAPPIASIVALRDIAHDCEFDTVALRCR